MFRSLPSVSKVLTDERIVNLTPLMPIAIVRSAVKSAVAEARSELTRNSDSTVVDLDWIVKKTIREVERATSPSLLPAVNATGIVLHTGLGRSRLCEEATEAIRKVAASHSMLELDAETGRRGNRQEHVEALLCHLTGAEAAGVVNNCAGAVALTLVAHTSGREVILSRGELVEIGGAFRMPDIIRSSGAHLVEVGTTNRTRIDDYRSAITDRTALILRCHPSNFAIVGFTESAADRELVDLGREFGIPVMEDQGAGSLIDPALLGLSASHGSLPLSVRNGYELITASGDKLLGATQAGIVLGRRDLVAKTMKHPMARALRIDKLSLAGLEATLQLYNDPNIALKSIPTLRYLNRTLFEIKQIAARIARSLRSMDTDNRFAITLVEESSYAGGGSLPGDAMPTVCVAIRNSSDAQSGSKSNGIRSADTLLAAFRSYQTPVIARIRDGAVLLDPRTLDTADIGIIIQAFKYLLHRDLNDRS